MKKIILLLFAVSFLFSSCSSDNSNDTIKNIPEKFDVKIEIKVNGGSSPKVYIAVGSLIVKQWDYIDLPFEGSYIYYTNGNEISNTGCKCINITASAYIGSVYKIESFNLYVNGKLVDTTNVASPPTSNGIMTPTTLEFTYNP